MKAEHRKELQTNLLADRMGRLLQGVKTAPKSRSTLIWVFLGLAVVTFGVWRFMAGASTRENSNLWLELDLISRRPNTDAMLDDLSQLAKANPGTMPARVARFSEARLRFERGQQTLASREQRPEAIKDLEDARKLYRELSQQCADVPQLAQEALLGAAKAEEALAKATTGTSEEPRGSLDRALELYQLAAQKYPDSILGKQAVANIERIEKHTQTIETLQADLNKLAQAKFPEDLGKAPELPPLPGLLPGMPPLPPLPFEPKKPADETTKPAEVAPKPAEEKKTPEPLEKKAEETKKPAADPKKP